MSNDEPLLAGQWTTWSTVDIPSRLHTLLLHPLIRSRHHSRDLIAAIHFSRRGVATHESSPSDGYNSGYNGTARAVNSLQVNALFFLGQGRISITSR
jgi:hypothetical protein